MGLADLVALAAVVATAVAKYAHENTMLAVFTTAQILTITDALEMADLQVAAMGEGLIKDLVVVELEPQIQDVMLETQTTILTSLQAERPVVAEVATRQVTVEIVASQEVQLLEQAVVVELGE